jgi:hypothetical protein
MRRNTLNFVVDTVTLLTMLLMISTGLLLKFVLPPRRGTGAYQMLWGWDRHDWGDVHFWTAVVLGGLLLLHVALHWKWVCATTRQFLQHGEERVPLTPASIRNIYGVAFLALIAAVIGGVLWFASAKVQIGRAEHEGGRGQRVAPATGGYGRGGWQTDRQGDERGSGAGHAVRESDDFHIRGSTTLGEIERMTGVSVAGLRAELNLPEDVSPDERLGQLRRDHGFEMSDVREAVQRLRQQQTKP